MTDDHDERGITTQPYSLKWKGRLYLGSKRAAFLPEGSYGARLYLPYADICDIPNAKEQGQVHIQAVGGRVFTFLVENHVPFRQELIERLFMFMDAMLGSELARERRAVGIFYPSFGSQSRYSAEKTLSALSALKKARKGKEAQKDILEVKMVFGKVVTMRSPRPRRPTKRLRRRPTPRQKRMKRSILACV